MRKKNSYLLLEVLVGIGLLAICLTPLIMHPVLCARKTIKTLKQIEFERISEVTLAEIQEQLLEKHPFEAIAPTLAETTLYPLSDYTYTLIPGKRKKLKRSYKIWKKRKCLNPKMICCRIYLGEKKEHFYSNLILLEETTKN